MPELKPELPYFAFGSNLDELQMAKRCPDHRCIGRARLKDHDLWFPRMSRTWGGGGASVRASAGRSVWGYMFALSAADWAALDRAEGYKPDGSGAHRKQQVSVTDEEGNDQMVVTYVARVETETKPTGKYMETIIRGAKARKLPADWIALLEGVPQLES